MTECKLPDEGVECFLGHLDGFRVPRKKIKGNEFIANIVSSLYYPEMGSPGVLTWIVSNVSSAAEFRVMYVLNSTGNKLLFHGRL